MTWKDITINQFDEIQSLMNKKLTDQEKLFELIKIIFKVDNVEDLPLTDYTRMVDELDFLKENIEPKPIKIKYKLGDIKCKIQYVGYSVAQYTDYTNYMNNDPHNTIGLISCVLVPTGMKYNEGYDIEEFKKEIGEKMSILDAMGITFFFRKLYLKTVKNMLKSLAKAAQKEREKMMK